MRKILVAAILSMFLATGFASAINIVKQNNTNNIEKTENTTSFLIDIYVDDDANPGWYDATHVKTIVEGITNASEGNTIFVYNGTYGRIEINKTVSIMGEDKNTTIIDGNRLGNVVSISAAWVNISGLTIQNSKRGFLISSGIRVTSDYNSIYDNIITKNGDGIYLSQADYNNISNNIITDNKKLLLGGGIHISDSTGNIVTNNFISNNRYSGIDIYESKNNTISNNHIKNNKGCGIWVVESSSNNITKNEIFRNRRGIALFDSIENKITQNNFIFNIISAHFSVTKLKNFNKNTWDGNYWNRPRLLPYVIHGAWSPDLYPILWLFLRIFFEKLPAFIVIPLLNFDFNPAKTPYEI